MRIEDRKIVLSLNAAWLPIGLRTVKQAFIAMNGGDSKNPPSKALDIVYQLKENGEYDFENPSFNLCDWNEWLSVPVREIDLCLNTARYKIRVPTVMIAVNFHKNVIKKPKYTNNAVWIRDNSTCQITGEKVDRKTGNIGHLKARAKGGLDEFTNVVIMKKELNQKQGTKTIQEMDWSLLRKPTAPKALPFSATIPCRERDWKWFLTSEDK